MRATERRDPADRGSATPVAAAGAAALLVVVLVVLQLAGAVAARHRAESAADLAALAGARQVYAGEQQACAAADSLAQANGAAVTDCTLAGFDVRVAVAVPVVGVIGGTAAARARAGPVVEVAPVAFVGDVDPPPPGSGISLALPHHPEVPEDLWGRTIAAPTAGVARGIAAGLRYLGLPYVWGGGGDGAGPDQGCSRGGGQFNACAGVVGFDCSGLSAFVLVAGGYSSPGGNSEAQRAGGLDVPLAAAQPGDIVGFPGHVAIHLGRIDGVAYILEASWVGIPVHIVPLATTSKTPDPFARRYWS